MIPFRRGPPGPVLCVEAVPRRRTSLRHSFLVSCFDPNRSHQSFTTHTNIHNVDTPTTSITRTTSTTTTSPTTPTMRTTPTTTLTRHSTLPGLLAVSEHASVPQFLSSLRFSTTAALPVPVHSAVSIISFRIRRAEFERRASREEDEEDENTDGAVDDVANEDLFEVPGGVKRGREKIAEGLREMVRGPREAV
jgi:hypothetical protein